MSRVKPRRKSLVVKKGDNIKHFLEEYTISRDLRKTPYPIHYVESVTEALHTEQVKVYSFKEESEALSIFEDVSIYNITFLVYSCIEFFPSIFTPCKEGISGIQ
jgi:hypothetical protein